MGRSKFSLEPKLGNVNEERDRLAQQNLELQAKRRDMKGRLDKVDDLKTQVDVTHEHVAVLRDTVVSKTEEVNDLKEKIESLKEQLDASRFQVSTFSEWVYLTQVFSCFKLTPIIIIVYFKYNKFRLWLKHASPWLCYY